MDLLPEVTAFVGVCLISGGEPVQHATTLGDRFRVQFVLLRRSGAFRAAPHDAYSRCCPDFITLSCHLNRRGCVVASIGSAGTLVVASLSMAQWRGVRPWRSGGGRILAHRVRLPGGLPPLLPQTTDFPGTHPSPMPCPFPPGA